MSTFYWRDDIQRKEVLDELAKDRYVSKDEELRQQKAFEEKVRQTELAELEIKIQLHAQEEAAKQSRKQLAQAETVLLGAIKSASNLTEVLALVDIVKMLRKS